MFARFSNRFSTTSMNSIASAMRFNSIIRMNTAARYSEVVIHNKTVYLAGQVPDRGVAERDMKVQTESVFRQIDEYLAKADSDKTRILSCQIFLKDMADIKVMNEVFEAWMPQGHAPARASVGNVSLANPDWLIEVCIIAAQK